MRKRALEAIENVLRELVDRMNDIEQSADARFASMQEDIERLDVKMKELDSEEERPEILAQKMSLEGISNVLNYEGGKNGR